MKEHLEKIKVPFFYGPAHGETMEFVVGHLDTMQRHHGSWIYIQAFPMSFLNWLCAKKDDYGPEDYFKEREAERKFYHNYKPVRHGDIHGKFYWILEHDPDCQCHKDILDSLEDQSLALPTNDEPPF